MGQKNMVNCQTMIMIIPKETFLFSLKFISSENQPRPFLVCSNFPSIKVQKKPTKWQGVVLMEAAFTLNEFLMADGGSLAVHAGCPQLCD